MVRLTWPMVFGIVSTMLLGVADVYFIGRLGTTELAAVSFALPITQIVINIALGVGMAISVLTSRLVGEGRHSEAARLITDGKLLGLVVAVVIIAVGLATIDPLFAAMGATEAVMPLIRDYITVWYVGAPFLMLTISGSTALRAIGDIKSSALLMALLSLLNVILDPLLIFGVGPFPRLGVPGAALATVIAGFITWICLCLVLVYREKMLDFRMPRATHLVPNWRALLNIGIPAVAANIMTPVTAAVMTAFIALHGPAAVAGFGVGARLEALALIIVFALSSTLPMFIGQNMGAGKKHRAYHALMGSLRFSVFFQAGVYLLLLLLSSVIASAFSEDPEVLRIIRIFLLVIPLSYGAQGIVVLCMVSLNVLKRPRTALLIAVIRLAVLYLPLAWLGAHFGGIAGLFVGAACGNVLAGVVAYRMIRQVCREQEIRPLPTPRRLSPP
jgi:putative MATE family efflux protein